MTSFGENTQRHFESEFPEIPAVSFRGSCKMLIATVINIGEVQRGSGEIRERSNV